MAKYTKDDIEKFSSEIKQIRNFLSTQKLANADRALATADELIPLLDSYGIGAKGQPLSRIPNAEKKQQPIIEKLDSLSFEIIKYMQTISRHIDEMSQLVSNPNQLKSVYYNTNDKKEVSAVADWHLTEASNCVNRIEAMLPKDVTVLPLEKIQTLINNYSQINEQKEKMDKELTSFVNESPIKSKNAEIEKQNEASHIKPLKAWIKVSDDLIKAVDYVNTTKLENKDFTNLIGWRAIAKKKLNPTYIMNETETNSVKNIYTEEYKKDYSTNPEKTFETYLEEKIKNTSHSEIFQNLTSAYDRASKNNTIKYTPMQKYLKRSGRHLRSFVGSGLVTAGLTAGVFALATVLNPLVGASSAAYFGVIAPAVAAGFGIGAAGSAIRQVRVNRRFKPVSDNIENHPDKKMILENISKLVTSRKKTELPKVKGFFKNLIQPFKKIANFASSRISLVKRVKDFEKNTGIKLGKNALQKLLNYNELKKYYKKSNKITFGRRLREKIAKEYYGDVIVGNLTIDRSKEKNPLINLISKDNKLLPKELEINGSKPVSEKEIKPLEETQEKNIPNKEPQQVKVPDLAFAKNDEINANDSHKKQELPVAPQNKQETVFNGNNSNKDAIAKGLLKAKKDAVISGETLEELLAEILGIDIGKFDQKAKEIEEKANETREKAVKTEEKSNEPVSTGPSRGIK